VRGLGGWPSAPPLLSRTSRPFRPSRPPTNDPATAAHPEVAEDQRSARTATATPDPPINEQLAMLQSVRLLAPTSPSLQNDSSLGGPSLASGAKSTDAADTYLHPQDRAYTVPEVFHLARGAGLRITGFMDKAMYNVSRYLWGGSMWDGERTGDAREPEQARQNIERRVGLMPWEDQLSFGEVWAGTKKSYTADTCLRFYIQCTTSSSAILTLRFDILHRTALRPDTITHHALQPPFVPLSGTIARHEFFVVRADNPITIPGGGVSEENVVRAAPGVSHVSRGEPPGSFNWGGSGEEPLVTHGDRRTVAAHASSDGGIERRGSGDVNSDSGGDSEHRGGASSLPPFPIPPNARFVPRWPASIDPAVLFDGVSGRATVSVGDSMTRRGVDLVFPIRRPAEVNKVLRCCVAVRLSDWWL
jgi:hypothetical protein